ncbi:MAG: VOC family protein [Planctomycetaceae bacterium]|nr:VOC family protein [Planctomycetaceae bacterium]
MAADHFAYPPLAPSLTVHDAAAAIEFYRHAFAAVERYRLLDPQTGKIGHAELEILGSLVMLADEYPQFNQSPQTLGGTSMRLALMVDDVDVWIARAERCGATVVIPAADMFYGFRAGRVRDPFGHEWMIQREIERVSPEEMQRRWNEMVQTS